MRVIFLDIDGVLVTHRSWRQRHPSGHACADPECVAALNHLIAQTGAHIVVSSTWRMGQRLIDLREIINGHFGVVGGVIDKTPKLSSKKMFEGKIGEIEVSAARGDEIDYWLRCDHREPIESFVILDDDGDMGRHAGRLVRTQFETGLTMRDAEIAIALLKGAAVTA